MLVTLGAVAFGLFMLALIVSFVNAWRLQDSIWQKQEKMFADIKRQRAQTQDLIAGYKEIGRRQQAIIELQRETRAIQRETLKRFE